MQAGYRADRSRRASPPTWPASSARPWRRPACASRRLPAAAASRSTWTATCGRRSSSTCSRTPSSSRSRARSRSRCEPSQDGAAAVLEVRDTGTGIPRRSCRASSSASTGSRARAAARTKAPASAWRWCRSWSSCTAARSRWRASWARAAPSRVAVPFGAAHLPPERIGAACRRWRPPPPAPTPTSRRRCAGCRTLASRRRPPRRSPAGRRAPAGAPAAILLADDNADMRDYVRPPARVRTTTSWRWRTARRRWTRRSRMPPDLVLTDVMMPALDGFGLLSALRAHPQTRTVPVILLSARAGEEARIEGLQARRRRLPGQAVHRPRTAGPRGHPPAHVPGAPRGGRRPCAPPRSASAWPSNPPTWARGITT